MIHEIADITPNGAATLVSAVSQKAAWVGFTAPLTNSATGIRVGGLGTDASHGAIVSPGGGFLFPPLGNANAYDLVTIKVFAAAGTDKIAVIYETN